MNKEEERFSLQQQTIELIKKLSEKHQCSLHTAAHIFYLLAKSKKVKTGFVLKTSFKSFYQQISTLL